MIETNPEPHNQAPYLAWTKICTQCGSRFEIDNLTAALSLCMHCRWKNLTGEVRMGETGDVANESDIRG